MIFYFKVVLETFIFLPVVVGNYVSEITVTHITLNHLGVFKSKNGVWTCSLLFPGSCLSGFFKN